LHKFNVVIYALFIFSGVIKSFMFIDILPVDLTLITAAYCVVVIIYNLWFSGKLYISGILVPLTILIAFYTWLTFSVIYSASSGYSLQKYMLSYLNLIAFCYPIFCKFCFKTFTKSLVFISLILLILFLIIKITFSYTFISDNNLKNIYLAFGVLLGFTLIFIRTLEFRSKPILFFILFLGLVISSARGPLIFYLLSVFIVSIYFIKIKPNSKIKIKLSYFLVPLATSALLILNPTTLEFITELFENTMLRFSAFFTSTGGESVNTRLELYVKAIDMFSENIFLGNGLGSFGIYVTGFDIKLYPHNIVLELLSETGLISVFILAVFVISLTKKLISNEIIALVFLYTLLNVMKSNSFEELRLFFGCLAVALLYIQDAKNSSHLHSKVSLLDKSNENS
jgi:O-antigen ligase